MKGKRAMMDDLFDLVFTIVAAFFVLIFLSGVLNANVNNSHKITLQHLDDFSAEQTFVKYLESPATVEGQQATVADLIVWSVNNYKYEELKQVTHNLLDTRNFNYNIIFYDTKEFREKTEGRNIVRVFDSIVYKGQILSRLGGELQVNYLYSVMQLPNYKNKDLKSITVLFKYKGAPRNE